MSEVVTLAEKVVAELEEYNAELSFFPEFELRDLDEMRVVVVPVGTQYKTLARSSHEELPVFKSVFLSVAVKKNCRNF